MTSNLSGGPPLPAEVIATIALQVAIIEQTYPAWRVERLILANGHPGGWRATRHVKLSEAELDAGRVQWIISEDHIGLVMRLAAQDAIA